MCRLLTALIVTLSLLKSGVASVLLQDNFNDNALDPGKWSVSRGSVVEQDQRLRLSDRGMLTTVPEFDPSATPVRITGTYTFIDSTWPDHDFLQIVTRSDGVPFGAYGEVKNGIEFQAWASGAIAIFSYVNGSATTISSPVLLDIHDNEIFEFEVMDDGLNLSFSLHQVGGDGTSAAVTAMSGLVFTQNHVVFYNRENNNSDVSINYLDDVTIEQQAGGVVPEPASILTFGGVLLIFLGARWNRP